MNKHNEELRQVTLGEYLKNPNRCLHCKEKIMPKGKENASALKRRLFCNLSCSAKYNKNREDTGDSKNIICPVCKKGFKGRKNSIFCSLRCAKINQHIEEWELKKKEIESSGEYPFNQNTGDTDNRVVKKYLIEKYGRVCSICKTVEWMGKEVPVVVDHIDGNSENHKVENFRLVCGNCDMQLPTYKSKNKNGRFWRRKRREEGKSC